MCLVPIFQHEVTGHLACAQDGQWQPDLGVERPRGRHGGPVLAEHVAEQVLGGRLAGRPGQRDNRRVPSLGQHVPGEVPERRYDVGDDDSWSPHGARGQDAGHAGGECLRGKVMPVGLRAGYRGEHPSGRCQA
jgi:hypothetical protein